MRNDADAQDLVQTTLEIALRHAAEVRDPSAMRAWLLIIETREAFRFSRRIRRLLAFEARVTEIAAAPALDAEHLDLYAAIGHLPLRVRAAIALHHLAGLSVDQTAAALGTSPNTVKSQLRDGLVRLRKELRDG